MGKRGHLHSPAKGTRLDSLYLKHFRSHEKNQNRCHKTFYQLKIYLNYDCGRNSAPDPTFRSRKEREECIGQEERRGEGWGEEEWRDRGMDRKEMEEVDFTALAIIPAGAYGHT